MSIKFSVLLLCITLMVFGPADVHPARIRTLAAQAPPASQSPLSTFVDRPADSIRTYNGSILYKLSQTSPSITDAVAAQAASDWEMYRIAKESNLGLPLGSLFLQAKNGKYVEVALYERAAFTVFAGKPARQILAAALMRGHIQVTEDEFIPLPLAAKLALLKVPIAGEGGSDTPTVGVLAKILTSDKGKASDANAVLADQQLTTDGTLAALDTKSGMEPLLLGPMDDITGHRTPQVMTAGLSRLFGEKMLENVGLPLSQAVWIVARINGSPMSICIQVFERMIVTYNPHNPSDYKVQVGLGGATLQKGLTVDAGQVQAAAPKVKEWYVWEDHMPLLGPKGPPLFLGGVLEVDDLTGFDFASPDNRVTLLRPTGERIISSNIPLKVYKIPGNPRPYKVGFDTALGYSPVPLVCQENLYALLEIRYMDSAVIVRLPFGTLGCPQ